MQTHADRYQTNVSESKTTSVATSVKAESEIKAILCIKIVGKKLLKIIKNF